MLPKLTKNAGFWLAAWRDSAGRRRFHSLGARTGEKKIGLREAERRLSDFATEHAKNPGSRDVGRAPSLADFIEHYFTARTDIDDSTVLLHRTTADRLCAYLDGGIRLDSVTRIKAAGFRQYLEKWTYTRTQVKGAKVYTLSDASIRKHLAIAKLMFQWATAHDIIKFNPFDRVKLGAAPAQENWEIVPMETLAKIHEACPSVAWRLAFSLARRAGLRSNEIRRAEWTWVDWKSQHIHIRRKGTRDTTKSRSRSVPMSPELQAELQAAYDAAPEGATLICPGIGADQPTVSHWADKILADAGLRWSKPLHTLRKSLESDWLAIHPVYDVADWLGHDPSVSKRHYHQTKKESADRVTKPIEQEAAS